jgi:hypothetical protein
VGLSFSILVLLLAVLNPLLRKWIVGPGRQEMDETEGKNIDLWGRIILAIIGLFLVFFVIDITDETTIKWFILIFLLITFGFDSMMEWKYLKNAKEFKVTLLLLLIGLIYWFLFIF